MTTKEYEQPLNSMVDFVHRSSREAEPNLNLENPIYKKAIRNLTFLLAS